jgi:hypothetical protein
MKKYIVIILISLFSCESFAQSFKFDVHAGANISKLVSGDKYMVYNSNTVPGEQMGGSIYYTFKNGLTLTSGLDLVMTGGKYSVYSSYYNVGGSSSPLTEFQKIKADELSFEIPFKLGYLFHLSKNIDLLPLVGCHIRYSVASMNGKCRLAGKTQSSNWNCFTNFVDGDHVVKSYDRFDFGYNVEARFIAHQHYILGLGYNRGITKKSSQFKIKNSDIRLTIGYVF